MPWKLLEGDVDWWSVACTAPPTHMNCRCSLAPLQEPLLDAGDLVDILKLLSPRQAVQHAGVLPASGLAVIKTALDIEKHRGLLVRALVEGWDIRRINEELY